MNVSEGWLFLLCMAAMLIGGALGFLLFMYVGDTWYKWHEARWWHWKDKPWGRVALCILMCTAAVAYVAYAISPLWR